MISIGIIGGSGYTAGELIRILMFHPHAKLDFVHTTKMLCFINSAP
jgi:N-acetyl-gamma-glutamyl-phosphate reductase